VGRDSAVVMVSRYRLDGPGIEILLGGGANISAPVHTNPVAHPAYYAIEGEKRQGRGVNYPPSSSAEAKERIDP